MVQTGSKVGLAFTLTIAAGLATCIGGAVVFSKRLIALANPKSLAIALGASAGVMVFISLVEIFGKSVENFGRGYHNSEDDSNCPDDDFTCNGVGWLLALVFFLIGGSIIFVLDWVVHKMAPELQHDLNVEDLEQLRRSYTEEDQEKGQVSDGYEVAKTPEGASVNAFKTTDKAALNRTGILTALALGIHNLPEGIATYIGVMSSTSFGAALAIGIALHNIPEGLAVATPIYFASGSRSKAFMWSFISAIAEPVGGIIAWLAVGDGVNGYVEGVMFGIVCGMMVTISFKELIPTAHKFLPDDKYVVILSIIAGMILMAFSLILFAFAGV